MAHLVIIAMMAQEHPGTVVTASARAEISFFAVGPSPGATGSLVVDLDGYRPPIPSELRSLVFGTSTHFEASLKVSADRRQVELALSVVGAGPPSGNPGGGAEG